MPDKLPRPNTTKAADPAVETVGGPPRDVNNDGFGDRPNPVPSASETAAAAAGVDPTPPPAHPHDIAGAFGGSIALEAESARRVGAALIRLEAARKALEALIPPEGIEDFGQGPTPEEAAAAMTEYLGARDQMADAMRSFGPPR